MVSREYEQLCIFADAVDNCSVVPERSTGLLEVPVKAVIAGLTRNPCWRAKVDAGSSPA
jgi:hypothetical protein